MEENFKAREKILYMMEKNLEIRQNIFASLKENSANKFFKWIKDSINKFCRNKNSSYLCKTKAKKNI
jgi:hypothetical protein